MNTIFVTSANLGCYGWLFQEHLKQRRRLFVENYKWVIPHDEHVERDQYDRHDTCYVLIEDEGALVGYARLLPTSSRAQYGTTCFTYMVNDASLGMLPGIPDTVYPNGTPPVCPTVWEMTRFHARDRTTMTLIFTTAAQHLRARGVARTISFTRSSYNGVLNALGLATKRAGPEIKFPDGKRYCVLETDLEHAASSTSGATLFPSKATNGSQRI